MTSIHKFLNPEGWLPAKGYANGILAEGRTIYTGGLVGWNGQQVFESTDLVGQLEQTLRNILAVLSEADARAEHIVRLTWYITDKQEYLSSLKEIGAVYRNIIGRHFPAMAVVEVSSLMEDAAKIEIEATAVIPNE